MNASTRQRFNASTLPLFNPPGSNGLIFNFLVRLLLTALNRSTDSWFATGRRIIFSRDRSWTKQEAGFAAEYQKAQRPAGLVKSSLAANMGDTTKVRCRIHWQEIDSPLGTEEASWVEATSDEMSRLFLGN
jgi:hypothetical protein